MSREQVRSPRPVHDRPWTAVAAMLVVWTAALLLVVPWSDAQVRSPQQVQTSADTVVSFTFDGSFKGQVEASRILAENNLAGTFYVNAGYLDFPAYLSVEQLRGISRAGHEIGGGSLYGNDLGRQSYDRAKREVCDDRATLAQLGSQVTSFSYPHGVATAQAVSVAKACGYNSGRDVAGLYQSPSECSSCPKAEMVPPRDDFSVRTAAPGATLPTLKLSVERAEKSGGWVPLVLTRVCTCPGRVANGEAITPAALRDFVQWLERRPASTRVRTVDQVLGGALKPVVGTPLPRIVPDPSSAIGTPDPAVDDDGSFWAILGAGTGRAQAIALVGIAALTVGAALVSAHRANRRRAARSSAAGPPSAAPNGRSRWPALAAGAVVAVAAVAGATIVEDAALNPFGGSEPSTSGQGTAPAATDQGADRLTVAPPVAVSTPGTYVRSRVTASGDVRVTQWVMTSEKQPITSLRLGLPPLPSGSVSVAANDLQVAADRVPVLVPSTVGSPGRLVRLTEPARLVHLTYTLRGAVETSDSVPGRVLVRATTLSLRYRPRFGPTRVSVTGGDVLSMACTSPVESSLTPCGTRVDGRWQTVLDGPERAGGVAVVVDLS